MEIYYQLWYLKAEVLRYRSNYQEAEECYEKAFAGAKRNKDHLGMSMALEGKARIFLDTIQPHQAEELLYEAIYQREKCREQKRERDNYIIYYLRIY